MTRVIGVCSGKGGVGKTTVATNLALTLQTMNKKVLLIDCNISTPHLAYYLGATDYKYTLNDVLSGKVDIMSAVHAHYGIKYIPASLNLKDLVAIEPAGFKKHLKKLLVPEKTDFIILDSAPGLGREAITVLDAADEIIFVTNPFAPMINDVIRSVEVLKQLKGGKTLSIVMNMVTEGSHEIFGKTLTEVTKMPVIAEIPFDRNVTYSLAAKSPLMNYSPNSSAGIGFKALGSYLVGESFRYPAKIRLMKMISKIKGYLLPQKFEMPQDVESAKEEIFIQKS